jgi:hypothetical protein
MKRLHISGKFGGGYIISPLDAETGPVAVESDEALVGYLRKCGLEQHRIDEVISHLAHHAPREITISVPRVE